MLPKTESACFVIADISGYTSFLAGVELDHAHDIIADVMDTVVKATHIEIRVAKPKPKDEAFLEQVGPEFHKNITSEVATLRQMLEGQQGVAAGVEEPALPVLEERFLTQPVNAR